MNKQDSFEVNEINFGELFHILWNKLFFIAFLTTLITLSSVFYALSIDNMYKSSSLLIPSKTNESLSSKLPNFSSLSGFAPVNILKTEVTKSQEAVQRMQSLDFFTNSVLPYINLHDLMAVKEWDQANNLIVYDQSLFNPTTKTWAINTNSSKNSRPSIQKSYRAYKRIFSVDEDRNSSFVTVSIVHKSPYIAKDWLDLIIKNINESMSIEDKQDAANSIAFLNKYSKTTNIQSLKYSISNLLESQMQTLMLSSINDGYIFKVLDSPFVPELKHSPNRAIISIIGLIFGFFISTSIVFFNHFYKKKIIIFN